MCAVFSVPPGSFPLGFPVLLEKLEVVSCGGTHLWSQYLSGVGSKTLSQNRYIAHKKSASFSGAISLFIFPVQKYLWMTNRMISGICFQIRIKMNRWGQAGQELVVFEAMDTYASVLSTFIYSWSFYIMKTLEPWLVGSICPVSQHCASLYRIQDYPWLVKQLSKVRTLCLIYALLSLSTLPASSSPLTSQLQSHCWKSPLTSDTLRLLTSTPTAC